MSEALRAEVSPLPERLGVYRIESRLGRGGMGEVFLAWDELLERPVAIKRVRPEYLGDAVHRARFRREARAVARLDHPSIVRVHHVLEREDGDYLVMEYVQGKDLRELLRHGPLDLRRSLALAAQVAEGLAEAHGKGMVHRDLKPANVMVTVAGRVKILDFGLAKALSPAGPAPAKEDEDTLTARGVLLGTAHAMSPEQAGGGFVDQRSDLFALGSLLYEMLCGEAPFRGTNVLDSLRRVMVHAPDSLEERLPGAPGALTALVSGLLAKRPEERPRGAAEVARELARLGAGLEAPGQPPGPGPSEADSAADPGPGLLRFPKLHEGQEEASAPPAPVLRILVCPRGGGGLLRESLEGPDEAILEELRRKFHGQRASGSEGGFFLFQHSASAVGFALALQASRRTLPPDEGFALGVHFGEVRLGPKAASGLRHLLPMAEGEEEASATAARLAARARPRQILLTRGVFDLARSLPEAPGSGELQWLAHGTYRLADLDRPVEIFEVGEPGRAPLEGPVEGPELERLATAPGDPAPGWRPAAGQKIPRRPNWSLTEKIGEGGFGEVWLAQHETGEERVFKFCFEEGRVRGLKREVTLFQLLREALGQHPHIARLLDWDFEEAPYFLEAEYTDGGSLDLWCARSGGLEAVPLEIRVELVAQVADALAAAHSVGVLHKDVKPQNVLVETDPDGRPRALLTDFGIASLSDAARLEAPGFTVLGFTEVSTEGNSLSAGGTLRYLAPELLEGKPASIQADIYALGVLLYQLTVGDLDRALAPGWRREIEDELLREDISACVDGDPGRRLAGAELLADRLRRLGERRAERQEKEELRRQEKRAARRWRLLKGGAIGAVLLLGLVSLFAVLTFRSKEREEQARGEADRRRQQAEGLIDFMLGDLREKLQPIGRLEILEDVGDEALEYFAGADEKSLSSEELRAYSRAMHQIGQVRFGLGKVEEAKEAFARSLRLAQDLAARDPERQEWQFELGQSHFWQGFLFWQQRDLKGAQREFQAYQEISAELVDETPEKQAWQLELAYAHSNLASVLEEQGELPRAAQELEVSARILERVSSEEEGSGPLSVELAHVYAKLGRVLENRGRLAAARVRYEAHLELIRRALGADPGSSELLRYLGFAHNHLGRVLGYLGRTEEALEHGLKDLEIATQVARRDPANLVWQEELALREGRVARRYLAQGALREARGHLEEDSRILETLLEENPQQRFWRLEKARNLWSWGLFELSTGNLEAARRHLEASLDSLESLEEEASYGLQRLWLARGGWLLGEVLEALGDGPAAAARRQGAEVVAVGLVEEDRSPVHVEILARLRISQGRASQAQSLVDELLGWGFREQSFLDFLSREGLV